ncbi:MAG: hypothetical protein AAFY56_01610, partial [Pseudomonadota bacterium]
MLRIRTRWVQHLSNEVRWRAFFRCLFVLAPLVVLAVATGSKAMVHVAFLAVTLNVVAERLDLRPVELVPQYLMSVLCIGFLIWVHSSIWLFAISCGLLASMAVAVRRWGSAANAMATWVFISGLYLTCEIAPEVRQETIG